MGELSLVFHLFSAAVVGSLIFLYLREQSKLRLWRDWGSVLGASRVLVAEPIRGLKMVADTIGARFDTEVDYQDLSARRIGLRGVFMLHHVAGIRAIHVKKQSTICVCFELMTEPSTILDIKAKIRSDFGQSIEVACIVV